MLSYLAPLRYKVRTLHTNIGAGINNGYPPFDIKAKYSTEEANLDSREYPVLNVRAPRSSYGDDLAGTQYGLSKRETTYVTVVDGTAWKYWNETTWADIKTLTVSADASQIDYMDKTILVNGTDMVYWNGSSTTGTVATMPPVDYLAVHANRIYAGYSGSSTMYYNALRIYNDWTTANDAGEIEIETRDGENCTGVIEYNDHIIYFKEHSCHELFGTGPINYTFQTLSDTIGCIAPRSIKEVQGTLFWLGAEGIYAYNGGTTPKLISYPYIQNDIDNIDTSNISKACAGTDGDRYYLCFSVDSNARIVITYDIKNKSWHIEDTANFIEFVEFDSELYGMQSDGQVKKMIGTAGESISWKWISKRYLNDYPSNKQSVRNIYIILTLPSGSALKCAVKTKEGSFVDVQTFSTSANIQLQQIKIPLTVAQNTPWYQIKFYGTKECTIHRFEIQTRIRSDSYNG